MLKNQNLGLKIFLILLKNRILSSPPSFAPQDFARLFELEGLKIGIVFPARTPYNGHKIMTGQANCCQPIYTTRRTL